MKMTFESMRLTIPTYHPETQACDESRPQVLNLHKATGLRVILGEPGAADAPDVLIERAADRWRLFVHANSGDPLCIVEITATEATVRADDPAHPEPLWTVPLTPTGDCQGDPS
ncbi:MAG: hypothetical protein JXB13_18730 [Phycisphaerae bacterium]|nr:hypothetical protein [Phycisphaerae bacterium]